MDRYTELEEVVSILEDARVTRDYFYSIEPDAEDITEDSVIATLLDHGLDNYETLRQTPRYVRALRLFIKKR